MNNIFETLGNALNPNQSTVMQVKKIVIEHPFYKDAENNIRACIAETKQKTVDNINRLLPSFKSGYGGHHIWVSLKDADSTRVAIIYLVN